MQCNKTLAFYIRLSAEDADLKSSGKAESNSVTNQRKLLRDYYEQHTELCEYEVVEFCDDGYTGTNFDRPQFMLMMEQIRRREIQAIMVKDLSRFGRDYLEVGAYLELILPLFGTRFISANDNFDSDNFIQQRFICESKECKQNQEPTRRVLGRQRFLWISVRS